MTAPALNDILSGDVLRVTLRFKLVSKLWSAFFNNASICKDMYEVRLDVLQDSCVVSNQQDAMVIGFLSAHYSFRNDAERIELLQKIFTDQRTLIKKYTQQPVEQVPQMFCAYKEVLGLYRQGLHVPDDITIVWPDDNFGYMRNFANAEERNRAGGFGVYYHLSYLGAPMAYLWLNTTPPALIWQEIELMHIELV